MKLSRLDYFLAGGVGLALVGVVAVVLVSRKRDELPAGPAAAHATPDSSPQASAGGDQPPGVMPAYLQTFDPTDPATQAEGRKLAEDPNMTERWLVLKDRKLVSAYNTPGAASATADAIPDSTVIGMVKRNGSIVLVSPQGAPDAPPPDSSKRNIGTDYQQGKTVR